MSVYVLVWIIVQGTLTRTGLCNRMKGSQELLSIVRGSVTNNNGFWIV
jgi:hypothetical protein